MQFPRSIMAQRRDRSSLLWGLAAGRAGTTALNLATYLDMAIRGRPASTAPRSQ